MTEKTLTTKDLLEPYKQYGPHILARRGRAHTKSATAMKVKRRLKLLMQQGW